MTTLFICLQCGMHRRDAEGLKIPNPDALKLADDTAALLKDTPIKVQLTRCLSLCDYPVAWGLRAEDRYAYTFAPAATAEDLAATARAWLANPNPAEKLPKRDMPAAVRSTLRSKLPPLPRP